MKAFWIVRRHRPVITMFQAKCKDLWSDQYEIVQAFDDPEKANAAKQKLSSRGNRFKYTVGRIAL